MEGLNLKSVNKSIHSCSTVAGFSKALRDPMNCSQIASLPGITPATVSRHLKTPAEAGLIECRRERQFIYNKPVQATIQNLRRGSLRRIGRPTRPQG